MVFVGRILACALAAILVLMMAGCAATADESARAGAIEAAPASASATAKTTTADAATSPNAVHTGLQAQHVAGVWEGRSIAQCLASMPDPGRCEAMQNITFTMFQSGDKVTGYYKCAYGNQVCRNLDESGVIKDGKMIKARLMMRVMLPDGSMCFFTGIPQNDHFNGGYSCLQGAGLIEQGRFYTQRSY
ncbi:MAG: hypothetical protein ACREQN_17205 [Candidatus Binataceae bacterium]